MTLRRRTLPRKETPAQEQTQGPTQDFIDAEFQEELETLSDELNRTAQEEETRRRKPKIIKRYPKQRCAVPECRNNAVGSGDLCKQHGGDPVVKDNLLPTEHIPDKMLTMTKFNPAEHPMQYIMLSREGMSDTEVANAFGVSVSTLRGWAEKFEDFHVAYEIGQAAHEAWWLKEGKANLDNRSYNVGLYKFLTGNKIGYAEKTESKNFNVNAGVLLVPQQMTGDEWEQAARGSK